ncbi:MAG: bestrophin family ion channel, partial [Flavobacteriales bacterium]|nr:bestrophin family ion channel [Flavobacteriales bacterium]
MSFHKSDTIRILWKELILMALLTTAISYLEIEFLVEASWHRELMAVYSLVGFVLSLLLVFRTNTGYERWWEGRKKWGELVNNTRNLAIKISSSSVFNQNDKDFFARMIPNYAYAMKEHLREGVNIEELSLIENEKQILINKEHKVNYIAKLIYDKLHEVKSRNELSEIEYLSLD